MRKLIPFAFALASFSATAFPADRHIAFERNNAVYVANLDGTNEKKIADGIFPAISPDGTRVARFFDSVKRDASSIRRDCWENSIGDLFLVRSAKIGNVNGVIAFESDLPISRKCSGRKAG